MKNLEKMKKNIAEGKAGFWSVCHHSLTAVSVRL